MKTRKPKTKIITGCSDCPFLEKNARGIFCNELGNTMIDLSGGKAVTPAWCPLKTQPITITYET